MKVGDLVRNLNSEARCTGLVIDFVHEEGRFYSVRMPVVLWADGRCSPIMMNMVVRSQ